MFNSLTWFKKNLYLLATLLYLPSLSIFFSGDDWFHLRISQVTTLGEFINFFSFSHTAQSAAFYRPLPTQVFFYIFQSLFGLTVWPYHLFVLLCFGYTLYLVKKFCSLYLKTEASQLTAVLVYSLSVSNFTRLYFLSAFQEVSLVIFSLLTLLNFPKSKTKAVIFFVLALMSKETAVVLPLLILIFNHKSLKVHLVKYLPIGLILTVYLYFRFMVFGGAVGDSYLWNFTPTKAANTLMWYLLWSFGAPELLVDYVGSGLRLVPKFFIDYVHWWRIIIFPLLGTILLTIGLAVKKTIRHCEDESPWQSSIPPLKFILFFLISISPVLFLPSHKFALELGLPLIGFSLAIAWLMPKKNNILSFSFFAFFILLNLSMNYLTYYRHYSVSRAVISQKVYQYINKDYPSYPEGSYFEFINDAKDLGSAWGQSKQISQSLSGSDFFRVYYQNPDLKVYYQDLPETTPIGQSAIMLSTKQFLK